MSEVSPFKKLFVIVWRVGLLAVVVYGMYVHFRPGPVKEEMHQYIGDPRTGCAYPSEKLAMRKLLQRDEEGHQSHWDEFQSLTQAQKAGYRACEVPPGG